MRKRAIENGNFVFSQKLGDQQISVSELREKNQSGDNSIANKIFVFWGNVAWNFSVPGSACKRVKGINSISNK